MDRWQQAYYDLFYVRNNLLRLDYSFCEGCRHVDGQIGAEEHEWGVLSCPVLRRPVGNWYRKITGEPLVMWYEFRCRCYDPGSEHACVSV